MDTNLGVISITEKQLTNIQTLCSDVILGFTHRSSSGEIVVTSTRALSEQEVTDLKAAISGLADEYSEDTLVARFNADVAIGREAQVFTSEELIRLMPYSYTLNELIRFKNFWGGESYAGLEQIGQGLVAGGQILQGDYDKLAGILLEQGIVL